MTRPWPARAATLAALAALVVAGCLTDAPTFSPEPTVTPEPEPTATITAWPLNTTVWYGGLVMTFGTAISTIDAKGGPVAVDVSIGNPGAGDASLDGPLRLIADGREVEPSRETVLPLVPGGGITRTTVVFEVDGAFPVADSAIWVGRPEEHRAIVPLVPGLHETVTLQPISVDVAVKGQAGSLFVELHELELRADLPDWDQELGSSVLALTLTYDATFRSDFSGGFAFTEANVALRLPDGTIVQPRRDGHSQSVLIILARDREIQLQSRFEVPVPGVGTYAFVVKDGAATTDLPFTIEVP